MPQRPDTRGMKTPDRTWFIFLALTFAVCGLTGLFASFAAPITLQRAMLRDEALDAARRALDTANPAASIEALRPRLDDSIKALLPFGGDMAARIDAERLAMHARLRIEDDAMATRLRWLVVVVTMGSAGFGMVLMGAASSRRGK